MECFGSGWACFWLSCFTGPTGNLSSVEGLNRSAFGISAMSNGNLRSLAKLRSKYVAARTVLVGSSCSWIGW